MSRRKRRRSLAETTPGKGQDDVLKPIENKQSSYQISPPPTPKRTLTVVIGGAHRGALENIPAFVEFNRSSQALALVPIYADPSPGRARELAQEAERRGVAARGVEGRVEDIDSVPSIDANSVLVLNLDRARAIANALKSIEKTPRAVLGYLLVKLPSGKLWAVRFVLEAHDDAARKQAIAFFERLGDVSERNSSAAILGEAADPAHALVEPAIRRWFGDHTKRNIAKLAAGVEPASAAFEVTSDGQTTLPLLVAIRDDWSDPGALADGLIANPASPIRKGTQLVVAEVTPHGIRFHSVRRRTDDRVTVGGVEVIDRAAVEAQSAHAVQRLDRLPPHVADEDAARREAAEVLARAARETLSRRNPALTTD